MVNQFRQSICRSQHAFCVLCGSMLDIACSLGRTPKCSLGWTLWNFVLIMQIELGNSFLDTKDGQNHQFKWEKFNFKWFLEIFSTFTTNIAEQADNGAWQSQLYQRGSRNQGYKAWPAAFANRSTHPQRDLCIYYHFGATSHQWKLRMRI